MVTIDDAVCIVYIVSVTMVKVADDVCNVYTFVLCYHGYTILYIFLYRSVYLSFLLPWLQSLTLFVLEIFKELPGLSGLFISCIASASLR